MTRFMFAILVIYSVCGHAQKPPIKFGEIPMSDMMMASYPLDSAAGAVVLADYGQAYVSVTSGTASLKFERHTRIKVLTKEGLDWANTSILLYHSNGREEILTGLKAVSYNLENGKIVETKMSKEGIFKERYNKNYNQQKFTIPNVKEGSIIEYTYKTSSEFVTNFPNWQFQKSIPTRHSEYWAMIPGMLYYQKFLQGYVPISSYEVKSQLYAGEEVNAHHWIVKNAPAFKSEPYMTSEHDYVSKINFALSHIQYTTHTEEVMGSWEKLNEDLLNNESFGKVVEGSGFLKDQVEQLITGMTDPLQKINTISSHIKQNVEWDTEEDFLADPLKKVLDRKKGTSGDINLLMGSMLAKAGLEVSMVLLSTRDHGFIRQQYPMTRQFNYVVCGVQLDDKFLLLDATEKYLAYDILPERCLNGQGLVISSKKYGWIDISTKGKAKTVVSTELMLEPTGELSGKLLYSRDGYDAQEMRASFHKKGQEGYVKDFLAGKQWVTGKSEFQDIDELTKSAREKYEIAINEHSSMAGDVIYINPFIVSQLSENPFKSEKREYPVDFGAPTEKTYMCKITVPNGYAVDEIPQSRLLALPGNAGKYLYNASQSGNSIMITSSLIINRSIFTQLEYQGLREFYNLVVAKQAEQIVVKKQ